MQDVLPPEAGGMFDCGDQRYAQSGSRAVIEYSLPMSGGVKVFEARLLPLIEDQVMAIVRNITGLKRARTRCAGPRKSC